LTPSDSPSVHAEVERILLDATSDESLDPQVIDQRVSALEKDLGPGVYSQLLYLLCHLNFPPQKAKPHWRAILQHQRGFQKKIGQDVDFRVALLDYFISVNHQLKNPKIIEIQIFKKTQNSAFRDELTGLYNYRYLRAELDREMRKAQRKSSPLSMVLFDVDNFKWYNDSHGHLEGDKALQALGRLLLKECRAGDVAARYGGEEFALLLPETTKPQAFLVADRFRKKVWEGKFAGSRTRPAGRFSISGGVATFRADAPDALRLLDAADKALYQAKGRGRNLVLTAGSESRSFPRVEVEIPGTLRILCCRNQPFRTLNISEQGLQFRCRDLVEEGDYFRFTLKMPDDGTEVTGMARAARVTRTDDVHEVGASIVEMPFPQAQRLREFLAEQRVEETEMTGAAQRG
jgi:diguanylate cyclase (GGDEF)-like protein